MALRIVAPTSCSGSSCNDEQPSIKPCQSEPRRRNFNMGTREKRPNIKINELSSPLKNTEELASSNLGHEIAILKLERLFHYSPSHPSGFGPCPPVPDFSGRPTRIAYQGARGSYCQEAAVMVFPNVPQVIPCDQMDEAFQCLEEKTADRAVVPIENSIDGVIGRNFDLLLRHHGVQILGELVVPVNHCLLAMPGVSMPRLKRVLSHPQALSHCRTRLLSMDVEIEEVSNAADVARYISDNRILDTAVIGSKIAAKEFGLTIVEENFQDMIGNSNRFLQLGPANAAPAPSSSTLGSMEKTSVAFSLSSGVSDLYRAMWQFETRGVPVVRVEQRPNRSKPVWIGGSDGEATYFDYIFIFDVEGSLSDKNVSSSVRELEEMTAYLRVLGSYTCMHA